jgi:hypothetical protein
MARIKHNDLTHYFMTPHEDLPASGCREQKAQHAEQEEFKAWKKKRKEKK